MATLLLAGAAAAAPPAPQPPCRPPSCIPSQATAQCGRAGVPLPAGAPQYHFHDISCGNNDPNGPLYDPNHRLYHVFYQSHEPGVSSCPSPPTPWVSLPSAEARCRRELSGPARVPG